MKQMPAGAKAIAELNTNVNSLCSKVYYESTKKLLGITNDTYLNDIVDNMKLPDTSEIVLWVNDDTQIGREVRAGIKRSFPNKEIFGYLTIKRTNTTFKLYLEDYCTTDVYVNSYTKVNNVGWYSEWKLK